MDVERIAEVIRRSGADIIALEEVDKRVRRNESVHQAQRLAELLGMKVAFGGNIELEGGNYGNAVLSRFPITSATNHLLPNDDGGEQRGVLEVELALSDSEPMTLLATHLDHRSQNQRMSSVTFVSDLAASIEHPVCLAGDFNATPDSPVLQRLQQDWTRSSEQEHPTIPVMEPQQQIDFVLFRRPSQDDDYGVNAALTRVLDDDAASDHRGILTERNLVRPANRH